LANYTLALTPESVDLAFEVRGSEVRLRTDRRNKGRPRTGRLASLTLRNAQLVELFEREFWTLLRVTEDRFKDKEAIADWLDDTFERPGRVNVDWDTVILYDAADMHLADALSRTLEGTGRTVWRQSTDRRPGRRWHISLGYDLPRVSSAIVLFGGGDSNPMGDFRVTSLVDELATTGRPIVKVTMPVESSRADTFDRYGAVVVIEDPSMIERIVEVLPSKALR